MFFNSSKNLHVYVDSIDEWLVMWYVVKTKTQFSCKSVVNIAFIEIWHKKYWTTSGVNVNDTHKQRTIISKKNGDTFHLTTVSHRRKIIFCAMKKNKSRKIVFLWTEFNTTSSYFAATSGFQKNDASQSLLIYWCLESASTRPDYYWGTHAWQDPR